MTSVFVDTVALIALGNQRDDLHRQTLEIQKQLAIIPVQWVTTNLIIAEFCNAFSAIKLHHIAILTVDSILKFQQWQYVHVNEEMMQQSYHLYKECQLRVKN